MCVKERNPEVPGTGSQTSRTEPPAVRDPGCQRRPDAVCPRLSVAAAVSRSGIMGTGRTPSHAFQVMGLMINRFAVLQNIRIGSLKYDVIKVDRKGHINA